MNEDQKQCCSRDYNYDGNCDQHPQGLANPELRPLKTSTQASQPNTPTNPRTETVVAQSIILTEEQCQAVTAISKWFELLVQPNGEFLQFKLGGYAGTGKTTIIKTIREVLNIRSVVCAFTGKACNVLQRKGISAQTIHSLIYDAFQDKTGWHFVKKIQLPGQPKLIIVDEASMLSTDLYNDLKSYGIKLLFVGDPGQLEPVGDNPNLMSQPDFVLSKIHRQAEASPIITLASNVRTGVGACLTHGISGASGEVTIRNKTITPEQLLQYKQFICAKNATRTAINERVRAYLRYAPRTLQPGEKIIVLRNNLSFAVFNGMILFVDEILYDRADNWHILAHDEADVSHTIDVWKRPFSPPPMKKDELIPRRFVYCDYAYAITCHKSQGSEWESVCVYDEWMPPQVWDMRRWRYTSITRAAKQLLYLV